MADYLLIFLASLTGSAHCVAMCGVFSLGLVRRGQLAGAMPALGLYHSGKIFTYIFLGALAGALGVAAQGLVGLDQAQRALAIAAGGLLLLSGLQTLGFAPALALLPRVGSALWLGPMMGALLGTFRDSRLPLGPFYLGLFNGFLPCGLVYAFTLKAATTGSLLGGMLTMAAFGLGTMPALLALALSGVWLAPQRQQQLRWLSGMLVLLLGLVTLMRGLSDATPLFSHQHH
jgi:hypothetical protein